MAKKLTDRGIKAIKAPEKRREQPDGLVSGLYLVIQPSGKRSWAVRYRVPGPNGPVTRKHTLGSASAINVMDARDLARTALVEVAKGGDPAAAKKAARNAKPKLTIEGLVSAYIEKYAKKETRPAVAHETERALKKELQRFSKRPADTITRRDLRDIIDDRLTDSQVATAIRIRALFSKMFKWAVEEEYLNTNPCVDLPKIKAPDSIERNLSAAEIHAVVNCAYSYGFPFGPYLLFLLCSGQRRTMTAETPWKEIDFSSRIWNIPKERIKNNKDHIVHLPLYLTELLYILPSYEEGCTSHSEKKTGFIFRNQDGNPISGFSDRKSAFDKYMVDQGHSLEPWTLHDLRRTASTSLSELGIEQVIIDLILSHQTGRTKDVSFIYNRNKQMSKRKEAMDRWGTYLDDLGPWSDPIDREKYGEMKASLPQRQGAKGQ